jgi:magnesium transporter
MTLIERQELVTRLLSRQEARQESAKQALVRTVVDRQHAAELEKKLNRLHPADAAFVLESLPQEKRATAFQLMRRERRGAILIELSGDVRASLVTLLDDSEILALSHQLRPEDLATLVTALPPERRSAVLSQLDTHERTEVGSVMAFPEGTVGALMKLEAVTILADQTLQEAVDALRERARLTMPVMAVVDRANVLQGVLTLERLLLGSGDTLVSQAMDPEPVFFFTDDRAQEAAQAFERYDLISAPVVNLHRQVVGHLAVDAVLEYVKQDTFRQSLSQVGLSEDEDLFAPAWQSARSRWVWLGLNLLTAFVASRVVGSFEGSIAELAALAALMPIVASIGGNTGNQTVALVIRGLVLSQLGPGNLAFLLRKELAVAGLNGTLWGFLMGLVTLALYQSASLALVMAIAMALNMLLGALVGVLCPVLLRRSGRDPVMGSSILLTATTDSMGFLIFLGLATALLL